MIKNKKYGCEKNNGLNGLILKLVLSSFILITPLLIMANVSADGGMIPYNEFDVYEPGQKAIIAWDGQQEIMILSVDVYSEESTKALHMVPFPSLPEVELGSVESFDKIEEIINRDRWGYGGEYDRKNGNDTIAAPGIENVEIVFHEKVGAHDITAVKINSPIEFSEWVNNFLKGKGINNKELPAELDTVVAHYTDQEIRYFVFDVIELETNTRSVNPIVYKFETDYLFFPLEISSIINGYTDITLALLMPPNLPINKNTIRELGFGETYNKIINKMDIKDISEEFETFFGDEASLSVYQGYFSLKYLEDDVVIRRLTNVNWMYTGDENFKAYKIADYNSDGTSEITLSSIDKLCVFNPTTGQLAHECNLNKKITYPYNTILHITEINSDNIPDIITHSWGDILQAIDGQDSTEIWKFNLKSFKKYEDYRIWGLEIPEKFNSDQIFLNLGGAILAINLQTGIIEWSHPFEGDFDGFEKITVDDFNLDLKLEVLVEFYDSPAYLLNAETGARLNLLNQLSINSKLIRYGDLTTNPGMELVYLERDEIYVIDLTSGQTLWTTYDYDLDLGHIHKVDVIDFTNDEKLDVILHTTKDIKILYGKNGNLLKELNLKSDNEDDDAYYLTNTEYGNLDNDGNLEVIGLARGALYIFDLETGDIDWKFSTGDSINFYNIKEIDTEGTYEILVVTGNKLYSVEYSEKKADSGSEYWKDQQFVIFGSIIVPIILIVIILMLIVRALDKRQWRYKV